MRKGTLVLAKILDRYNKVVLRNNWQESCYVQKMIKDKLYGACDQSCMCCARSYSVFPARCNRRLIQRLK